MTCGPMNLAAVAVFAPPWPYIRTMVGLPEAHPLYLWVMTAWVPLFGMAYFRMGWTGRLDRTFLAVGTAGKATFALILLGLGVNKELPASAAVLGLPDLGLATVFVCRLCRTR